MQLKGLPPSNEVVRAHPVDFALDLLSSAQAVRMQLLPPATV